MKTNLMLCSGSLLFTFTPLTWAATASTSFAVTATVNASCSISANPLAFGGYDPFSASPNDALTTLSATCTATTPYTVGLNAGTGSGATVATRKMTSSSNTLNYSLYQDAARTTVWGSTIGTDTVAGTGIGTAQSLTVYGRIPASQNVPAGNYNDTIIVTITY